MVVSYRRSVQTKARLKRLSKKTPHCYAGGAWYDPEKGRYIRIYISGRTARPKFHRKMSNKKLRRYPEVMNHGLYRKVYDYWWEIF